MIKIKNWEKFTESSSSAYINYDAQYPMDTVTVSESKEIKKVVDEYVMTTRSISLSWFNPVSGEIALGWDARGGGNPLELVDMLIRKIRKELYIDYHLFPQLRDEKSSQFVIYPIDTSELGPK